MKTGKKEKKQLMVKILLISISVLFLGIMLILPLFVVITEALRKGWAFYIEAVTDEYTVKALILTLQATAAAVVFPKSTEEVSRILRYAHDNNVPVTPRGAGTNLVGSTVPTGQGIVLDLSYMNKIIELDKETFTATVEPGVILEDFQSYVEENDLFYPPDPGEKRASIGGNISTNAGGMRAVKYGVTRNYVLALDLYKNT